MEKERFNDSIDDLVSTSEMLDEEVYWTIVEDSRKNSASQKDQQADLIKRLEALTLKEIIGFRLRTDKLLYDTYNSEMWCAASLMNKGCSDDGFEYFRNWVIASGREVYDKARANPDTLVSGIDERLEYYDFESFWYVALEAFENRTGKDLYDYIDFQEFIYHEMNYPGIDFNWERSDPDSMKALCPQLFARMWKE